uniref:Si:dkey-118j18.2 n=1 Tax=Neogobius melanostomus TaxID=47308 RepID=A0A8C6UC61_9GOBI
MELYWYIVVVVFIIIKIFFYVCWYRSTQRQLAAYLRTPRNAQIVIVGGRAYLHQMCERQGDDLSMEEASSALPPAPSFSHLDMPPPYDAVSREEELKPPPYSECTHSDGAAAASLIRDGGDSISVNEAPPPYTPSPPRHVPQPGPQSERHVPQPAAQSGSCGPS